MIGKIYKIIHNQSNFCYVGSTFNKLRIRWQQHKQSLKDNKRCKISIYLYMIKYGIENFKILLIKEYDVFDKKHLLAYEQLWINKLETVNNNNTLRLDFINRHQYLNKKKKYYNENKDTKIKEYLEKTKEKRLLQGREYREKNKEKIKQIIKCECGGTYSGYNNFKKERHFNSKKHQNYVVNNIDKL